MAIGNKETEAVFSKEKIVDLVYRFAERKRISKEATANVIEEKRACNTKYHCFNLQINGNLLKR